MIKTIKRWGPVVLWMLVMYNFSARPTIAPVAAFDWLDFIIKKSAHLAEYAILFILSFRAFGVKNRSEKAFFLGLMFAFTDEIHQMFSPGRTAMIRDILVFDTGGLVIGWFLSSRIKKIQKWLKK